MSSLLKVEHLSVDVDEGHLWNRRRNRILNSVSFDIPEGEMVAYLGPNGAGKTTTFRAICGLSTQFKGKLYWKNSPISFKQLHNLIGFLPEHPYFYKALTPNELLFGLGRLSRLSPEGLKKEIPSLAEKLNFAEVLNRPIRTCSKGQLQRVGLAQAIIHNPKLLILDEPMSGLDPFGRELVRQVLRELCNEGATILFSSHILADAESLCHRVIALHKGNIIYTGKLEQLVQQGGHWEIIFRGKLPANLQQLETTSLPDGSKRLCSQEKIFPMQKAAKACLDTAETELVSARPVRDSLENAFLSLVGKADT